MAKNKAGKKMWVCSDCGQESGQWLGKCQNCGGWNTFKEIRVENETEAVLQKHSINLEKNSLKTKTIAGVLEEIKGSKIQQIYPFSVKPLNDFFTKGITAGSLTLLAGEPGLGKSTLCLQLLRALFSQDKNLNLLYITAEESIHELARRSVRLMVPQELFLAQANDFEQIEQIILENKPNVVVIDSIQTIFSAKIDSSPGSVSQVSTLASRFLAISKAHNFSIIIVGHVTKEGQIAGPKTLEHLVDSVLLLEGGENPQYRTLSFSKHRFGSTNGLLLLKMEENGLQIVTDPSLALLENIERGVGVVYGVGMNKDLASIVEIQALATSVKDGEFKKGFGQRQALGISGAKLNTIIAIIEKYLNISLTSTDIFLQISGFSKNITDSSLDLPIMLAILSSSFNMPVEQILGSKNNKKNTENIKNCYAGRLTLSGSVRQSTQENVRQDIAKKLGFNFNDGISFGKIKENIKIIGA